MTIIRRITVGITAAVLAVAGAAGTAAGSTTAPAPPARSVLQAQEQAVVAAGAPGISARVRDENGTWTGVAGTGNLRTGSRPAANGEIRVGSITKSFVATVVLQLIAQKRVQLEAPISRYLPGLLPYAQPITIHELLQHRSGLVDYANIQPSVLWPTPEAISTTRFHTYTPLQLLHIATAHPLLFAPGSQWSYSNTNYVLLGLLIQKVTHHDLAVELARRILIPLGLRHTYLAGAWPFLPRPAEHGYEVLQAGAAPTDVTTYNMTWAGSAGALVSTSADLERFYRALLTGKLLPPAQLAQMEQTVPISDIDSYGLGLMAAQACSDIVWGHNGSVPGYLTYTFTNSQATRQITVSVNRSLTLDPKVPEAINSLLATEFCGSSGSSGSKAPARPQLLPLHPVW